MLSSKLVQILSDNWEQIAERVIRQVRRDAKTYEMGNLPESALRERCREVITDLPNWLVSAENDHSVKYETLGCRRYEEGVPLHEMVRTYQIIRENLIQYVRDQLLETTVLYLYAEGELDRRADAMFDAMIYYLVRGYERVLRGQAHGAA